MTNGEKLIEIFPDIQIFNVTENEQREKFIHIRLKDVCQAIELDWWDAEHKESTTKNDLGVEYISRSELMAILSDYYDTTVEYRSMLKEIAALPPVTPQPRWIPVSEKLPASYEDVLVTNGIGTYVGWIDSTDKRWRVNSESEYFMDEMVAWMPLPKAYKEVEE